MPRREVGQFVELVVRPSAAITASEVKDGTWWATFRGLFVVLLFVLANLVALQYQAITHIDEISTLEFIVGVYNTLMLFLLLLTSLLVGYLIALVMLSRTRGLVASLRSLLYAGGGFLVLHISLEMLMPIQYQPALQTIRMDTFSLLGVETVRDYYFGGGLTWDYRVDLFDTQPPFSVFGDRTIDVVYQQPVIVELLTTPLPLVVFLLWLGSLLYFFYLIFLDAHLNHGLSPAEATLAVFVAITVHIVEMATHTSPLRELAYEPESQWAVSQFLQDIAGYVTSILPVIP